MASFRTNPTPSSPTASASTRDRTQGDTIVVGRDMRLEGPMLAEAPTRGILEVEANFINIGVCGTEVV